MLMDGNTCVEMISNLRSPSCGDVLKFQILVDDNGRVIDAKFKAFGCGSAIASSSYATELVKGKTIEDCMMITNNDIASHLSLPPVKKHCSLLAEEAIRKATEDYMKKKQAKKEQQTSTTGTTSTTTTNTSNDSS